MFGYITALSLGWKLAIAAAFTAMVAGTTFHFTSNHYSEKIVELREQAKQDEERLRRDVKDRDGALATVKEGNAALKQAVQVQNSSIQALRDEADAAIASASRARQQLAKSRAESDERIVELAKLRAKNVDYAKQLTAAQINTTISDCELAEELNAKHGAKK